MIMNDIKPLENPLVFLFDLAFRLAELAQKLVDFMFFEISIAGIDVSVWQALGGFGLTTLIVYSIVR